MSERELPDGWVETDLREVSEILDRFRVPINAKERAKRQGSIPYYGATGQVGWIDHHIFDEELILLGEDGAPFFDPSRPVAYLIRGKSWVNNHSHVLKARAISSNVFLMHQLNTINYRPFVGGTTRLKLSQNSMMRIQLRIPPLPEQRRIVDAIESYLTRLDDAIASLERVQRNLKRYRASVLQAAVEGRLVPTEAKLAREDGREYEPASVLLKRILVDRREKFLTDAAEKGHAKAEAKAKANGKAWSREEDAQALETERKKAELKYVEPAAPNTDDLPDLPEGWCWASVEQLSYELTYGSSQKANVEDSDGIPVLRMGNIQDGKLDTNSLKYLPSDSEEFPFLLLKTGDLLFNRTNSPELVGKTAVFREQLEPCTFASYLIRVRFLGEVLPEFVSSVINSFYGRTWIGSVVTQQVGQANVNGTKLKACIIPLPPANEQRQIMLEVERFLSIVDETQQSTAYNLSRSKRLRQSILKWAFEGKLVDQDPNDEPASALLQRIKAERAEREAAEKAAKKTRKTSASQKPRAKKSAPKASKKKSAAKGRRKSS